MLVPVFILSINIRMQVVVLISYYGFTYLVIFLVVKIWHKNIIIVPKQSEE